MNRNMALLLGGLTILFGCSGDVGEQAVVLGSAEPPEDCENVRGVCTASFPSTCYYYCGDDPEPGDPDGCDSSLVSTDESGASTTVCLPEPEPRECEWVCTASYPSTCYEICPGDGTEPPGCAVSYDVETGEETTFCPGEPPVDPEPEGPPDTDPGSPPECEMVCTASYPSRCYEICPDGAEPPPDAECSTVTDGEGGTTSLICPEPPSTGGGSEPGSGEVDAEECHEVCTLSDPPICHTVCPGDADPGTDSDCIVSYDPATDETVTVCPSGSDEGDSEGGSPAS